MKNITLDRATVLQLDPDGTDRALDAAANCDVLRNDACPQPVRPRRSGDPRRATRLGFGRRPALDHCIQCCRRSTCRSRCKSLFPLSSSAPASPCSTTECCCCTVLSMTSVAFAAAFLSFSGALLLKLLNMSTSRFRRHALRERAKAVFLRSSASWRRAFYSPRGETLRLGRHLRTGLRKRELPPRWRVPNSDRRGTLRSPTGS